MCAQNGLKVNPIPTQFQDMTQLEQDCCATNKIFMKIHVKGKMRWKNQKDKVINVPVREEDMLNTVQSMPKTPDEAGLIQLNWNYKKDIKTPYKSELVRPKLILDLLSYLKNHKNPYYQFYDDYQTYKKRLDAVKITYQNKVNPIEDLNEDIVKIISEKINKIKFEKSQLIEEISNDEDEDEAKEEENYIENDPIRKYQPKDYDHSVLLANMHPEMDHESQTKSVTITPGEGNTPKSILNDKDWDVKAFPLLHSPGGKYGLHHERKVNITDQNYFVQRSQNYIQKYANSTPWYYAAVGYIEQKQISRNIALEGKRGREVMGENGKTTFKLDEPYAVLDNIPGTPSYWKKAKNEMYAKLDNHGPFHLFFTLSCGDTRWKENLGTILAKSGMLVEYTNQSNKLHIKIKNHCEEWMDLDRYLEDCPDNLNTYIRQNILTMARYYNQRVKAFLNEIVVGKNNPMAVHNWTYKTEFGGRGAAHVHGVLWLNMNIMENYCQTKNGQLLTENQIENISGMKKKLQDDGEDILELKNNKPFKNLKEVYKKIRNGNTLNTDEVNQLINFTDTMVTVSKCPAEIEKMCPSVDGQEVVKIVEEVNIHCHTLTCKKKESKQCRFNFTKYPCWKTLIARPLHLTMEEEPTEIDPSETPEIIKEGETPRVKSEVTLRKVSILMENEALINDIMEKIPKLPTDSLEENTYKRKLRIMELLNKADVTEDEYISALQYSPKGYTVIFQRDLDEMMVNCYNPEWIINWNANIDIQPVHDFFGAITYVTEYWGKDETKTMVAIKSALDNCQNETVKEKMKIIGNTFMKSRQIGEVEGWYKLLPDMLLKNSSSSCQWVSLENPQEGYKRMRRAQDGAKKNKTNVEIDGQDGLWTQQPDTLDKFLRIIPKSEDSNIVDEQSIADPKDISLAQMAKMYTPSAKIRQNKQEEIEAYHNKQRSDIHPEAMDYIQDNEEYQVDQFRYEDNPDQKFRYLMCPNNMEKKLLPECIKLSDPKPGELPFLRLRTYPAVLRFRKSNRHTQPHEYFRKEIMLYLAGWDEELFKLTEEQLLEKYNNNKHKIQQVKSQVMEHLESVEEARLFVQQAEEKLSLETTALTMDAENEQSILENEDIEDIYPDMFYLDEDIEEDRPKTKPSIYKPINLLMPEELEQKTHQLDIWQRHILDIVVKYGKDIKKADHNKTKPPKPPHLMVHGGAGAGKSTVIDTLVPHFEKIMRKAGDDGSQPYVIKTAPTGAAASQIGGITIHSAFNFDFSGKFYSLPDKTRAKKREELKNLKMLVIDEISMVSADMLYMIALRLQEIKENNNEPFGGVMLVCLGDLMQLQPVMARYIFEEPIRENYKIMYKLNSFWESLTVINLEVNHRQEGDKQYADLLNRMRIGQLTEEDMNNLQERVRSKEHPDYKNADMFISGTRAEVNKLNKQCMERINGEEITLKATHCQELQKKCTPNINQRGEIGQTGFLDILKLKIGCRVMLISNINITDGLSNGQLGELKDVVKGSTGEIHTLMIKFTKENVGHIWREENPILAKKYPGYTGIKRIMHSYSKNYRKDNAKNIQLHQFPIIVAHAVTAHKIQGQNIHKPMTVALDVCSIFAENQAHVMFSRVQVSEQVIIVEKFEKEDIRTSKKALAELKKMNKRSLNENPTPWYRKSENSIKIASLNCRRLQTNFDHIKNDPTLMNSDILNLSETWLDEETNKTCGLKLEDYNQHFTSQGKGKGIVSYYKDKLFKLDRDISKQTAQIAKISSEKLDIIHIYRSNTHPLDELTNDIINMIEDEKTTLIVGDFNVCIKKNPNNKLSETMKDFGFIQLLEEATHMLGGYLDHAYYRSCKSIYPHIERYSPFYSDHDATCITLIDEDPDNQQVI